MKKDLKHFIFTQAAFWALILITFFSTSLTVHAATDGWIKKDNNTYYYKNNIPLTGFHEIDEDGYYFNQNGIMQTGQITIQGHTYYFDPKDGKMGFGWVSTNNRDYYYSINGTVGSHVNAKNVKGKYKKGSIYGSKLSSKELKQVKKKVISFMNTMVADNMTSIEKVKAAHDYICNNTSYKKTNKSGTAYGALVKKKAVCTGYSRAFIALCDSMGIQSKLVSATNVSHTWNVVKIGTKWYHIDVQTDDSYGGYPLFLTNDSIWKKMKFKWKKSTPKCSENISYTIPLPEEGAY